MPKQAKGLSARKVETTKEPGLHADGGGLYLQVGRSGAKSWIFRYSFGGKRRDMGLGSLSAVSLAEARQKAQEAREGIAAGIDPIDSRKHVAAPLAVPEKPATTFRDVAEAYMEAHAPGWRNAKHAAQWASSLKGYAYPAFGDKAIDQIDTPDVMAALSPIWATKTETAYRLRGRIETVLGYAKVAGLRSGDNPARWKDHIDHMLPAKGAVAKTDHYASLPYPDLPAFMVRLQAQDGAGARALEFAILTACRTGEVLGARWDELDADLTLWTLPPARMKAGALHRAPLSAPARALLRRMATVRQGDFVFTGARPGRPLSGNALLMLVRRLGVADVATPHGFRSTFRTWAAERTAYPADVCEAALAHTQGDKVVAAYQRGDLLEKRKALMADWGAYCVGG